MYADDGVVKVVGRLAAQISKILQGKDKPLYSPEKDLGDVCIVVNASQIEFTGKKWDQKVYRWHTGEGIFLDWLVSWMDATFHFKC